MMSLVPPDAQQLSQLMSQATAPAFVLGAVAGFVSILLGRMTAVNWRSSDRRCVILLLSLI